MIAPNTVAIYRYDALGRRIEKEIDTGTVAVTRYLYDNEDILLELNASNNIIARYTHGPGVDEPLIMERTGSTYWYHADALGSITSLSNEAGAIVQSYAYSTFGKIESQLNATDEQPYRYTSREWDDVTGLYHYRARAYDAVIGRFLQEDPARTSGGDNNFYTYALNNPALNTDPSGRVVQVVTPDTYVDLAFLAYDLYRILVDNLLGNCSNLDENLRSLGANLAGLAIPGVTGLGAATRGGKLGRLVIGKLDDLTPASLKPGEFVLDWANKNTSKFNWQENSSLLRKAMSEGNPIRDASVVPSTGALRSNTGFLSAERNLLANQGWKFNPQSGHWHPPIGK
jgi:RHS repeat-associated protein